MWCKAKHWANHHLQVIVYWSLDVSFLPVKKSRTFTLTDPAPAMAYWNNELSCQTCKESCSNQYLCNWMSNELDGRKPVRAPKHLLLLALLIEIHGWGSKCPPVYCFLCDLTIWLSNMTWQELDYCAHRATQAEVQAHLPKSLLHPVRLHSLHACLHLQRIDHLQQISAGL